MSGTRTNRIPFSQRKEQIVFSNPDDRRDGRTKQHSEIHPDDKWKVCVHYKLKGWRKISCKSEAQGRKLFLYYTEKSSSKSAGIEYIVLQKLEDCRGWIDVATLS